MDLTTPERFKQYYAVTQPATAIPNAGTADDALIAEMITEVSQDILVYLDRPNIWRATYADYYNGTGGYVQMLRQWPVVAVNSLTVDGGTALTAAAYPNSGYFLDPWQGSPPGVQQTISLIGGQGAFTRGLRNVYVNYDAGYCIEDESATIGSTPYQITVAAPYGAWAQDDGVTDSAGTAFTKVTGTPAAGQYSVVNGVYTFAAADTGTGVLISYSYVPSALEKACFKMVAEEYAYRQRIGQKSHTIPTGVSVSFDTSIMTMPIIKALQPFKRVVPY